MDIKDKKLGFIALILISAINIFGNCNKQPFCQTAVYNFDIGIKAYPDADSINIGDTIFFEITELTTLTDLATGASINFSNAKNLTTAIGISRLISPNVYNTYANSSFKFHLISGVNIPRADTNHFREYQLLESNQQYRLKFGLIPLDSGVYKMFVSSVANVFREGDNCSKANFSVNFKNTNQHLYFNAVSFPGVILQPGGGIYLFKVK